MEIYRRMSKTTPCAASNDSAFFAERVWSNQAWTHRFSLRWWRRWRKWWKFSCKCQNHCKNTVICSGEQFSILPCHYRFVVKLLKSLTHAEGIRLIFFIFHCVSNQDFPVFYHSTPHANILPSTDCHSPGRQSLVRRDVQLFNDV